MRYPQFRKVFEARLQAWVNDNRYLIDEKKRQAGESETKEFYFMLTKPYHSNIVKRKQPASEYGDLGGHVKPKGAFLYTDPKEKGEIVFGLNKSFFITKGGADLPGGVDLCQIAEEIRSASKKISGPC